MQANAMWSQLISEILLHFPEWPIRELLRLFAARTFFLSRVPLYSFDVSDIHIGGGLFQTPVDKLFRYFMERIPQLSFGFG